MIVGIAAMTGVAATAIAGVAGIVMIVGIAVMTGVAATVTIGVAATVEIGKFPPKPHPLKTTLSLNCETSSATSDQVAAHIVEAEAAAAATGTGLRANPAFRLVF